MDDLRYFIRENGEAAVAIILGSLSISMFMSAGYAWFGQRMRERRRRKIQLPRTEDER